MVGKPACLERAVEHIDTDGLGVRLFKAEPASEHKAKVTISACSRNGGAHVSVSIELERGAWVQIVSALGEIWPMPQARAKRGELAVKEIYYADEEVE